MRDRAQLFELNGLRRIASAIAIRALNRSWGCRDIAGLAQIDALVGKDHLIARQAHHALDIVDTWVFRIFKDHDITALWLTRFDHDTVG